MDIPLTLQDLPFVPTSGPLTPCPVLPQSFSEVPLPMWNITSVNMKRAALAGSEALRGVRTAGLPWVALEELQSLFFLC